MLDLLLSPFVDQIVKVIAKVFNTFIKRIAEKVVDRVLYEGKFSDEYTTKDAIQQIIYRYKVSIEDVNRAISLNIGFSILAFYAYFVLPVTGSLEVPIIGLSVSKEWWIGIAPLISYGLQILIFTSLIWFLALRLSLRIAKIDSRKNIVAMTEETSSAEIIRHRSEDKIPDFSNLLLKGILGHLWILFRISNFIKLRINYFWYYPFLILTLIILVSPFLVCVYFVFQLYAASSFWLGIIYTLMLLPSLVLFILLLCIITLLGVSERLAI